MLFTHNPKLDRFEHPRDAVLHTLASARDGYPADLLRRDLGMSEKQLTQLLDQMLVDGWLHHNHSNYFINPDRPGLAAYLEWLYVEYGTEDQEFWYQLDHASNRFYQAPSIFHDPVRELADSLPLPTSTSPVDGRTFRAMALQLRPFFTWKRDLLAQQHELYRILHNERCRDFIHIFANWDGGVDRPGESILCAKRVRNEHDARREIAVLTASLDAQAHWLAGQALRFIDAGELGRRHAEATRRVAAGSFPWLQNAHPYSLRDIVHGALTVAVLTDAIDQPARNGYKHLWHGGTPAVTDLGQGGDILFGAQCYQWASYLHRLAGEGRTLPGMADILTAPQLHQFTEIGTGDLPELSVLTIPQAPSPATPTTTSRLPLSDHSYVSTKPAFSPPAMRCTSSATSRSPHPSSCAKSTRTSSRSSCASALRSKPTSPGPSSQPRSRSCDPTDAACPPPPQPNSSSWRCWPSSCPVSCTRPA